MQNPDDRLSSLSAFVIGFCPKANIGWTHTTYGAKHKLSKIHFSIHTVGYLPLITAELIVISLFSQISYSNVYFPVLRIISTNLQDGHWLPWLWSLEPLLTHLDSPDQRQLYLTFRFQDQNDYFSSEEKFIVVRKTRLKQQMELQIKKNCFLTPKWKQ